MIKLEWNIHIGFHWNMFHLLLLNGHWLDTIKHWATDKSYTTPAGGTPRRARVSESLPATGPPPVPAAVWWRQQVVRKLQIDCCLSQWIKINHGDQLLPPYFPPALVRVHVLIKLQVWPTLQRTSPSWCLIPVCSNCYRVRQGLASQSILPLKFKPHSTEQSLLM